MERFALRAPCRPLAMMCHTDAPVQCPRLRQCRCKRPAPLPLPAARARAPASSSLSSRHFRSHRSDGGLTPAEHDPQEAQGPALPQARGPVAVHARERLGQRVPVRPGPRCLPPSDCRAEGCGRAVWLWAGRCWFPAGGKLPRVTFRRVVVSLRGPGQSPVLPFACCVGSLRSVGRCGRQNAATRRNMRREERVTVQGPVKKQQLDGKSHRGTGGEGAGQGPGRPPPRNPASRGGSRH